MSIYQVFALNTIPQISSIRISLELYVLCVLILFCQLNPNGINVFYMLLKIAVFNFVLLVILIRCFHAIIPQPVVDTFSLLLLLPMKYLYTPTWENRTNYKYLFVYILGTSRNIKILRILSGI